MKNENTHKNFNRSMNESGYGANLSMAQRSTKRGRNKTIVYSDRGSESMSTWQGSEGKVEQPEEKKEQKEFNLRRSCLSEVKIMRELNEPSTINMRAPTQQQYDESQIIYPLQRKSQNEYYNIYNQQKNYDTLATMLAIFGLIIAVVNYQQVVHKYDIKGVQKTDKDGNPVLAS